VYIQQLCRVGIGRQTSLYSSSVRVKLRSGLGLGWRLASCHRGARCRSSRVACGGCGGAVVSGSAPMVGAKGGQRRYIYLIFNKALLLPRSASFWRSASDGRMSYIVTQFRYLEIMCYSLATPSIMCYKFVTLFTSLILCVTNSGWTQLVCY
jgi:hypothetical protein